MEEEKTPEVSNDNTPVGDLTEEYAQVSDTSTMEQDLPGNSIQGDSIAYETLPEEQNGDGLDSTDNTIEVGGEETDSFDSGELSSTGQDYPEVDPADHPLDEMTEQFVNGTQLESTEQEDEQVDIDSPNARQGLFAQELNANNSTIIGELILNQVQKEAEESKLVLRELMPTDWRKVKDVFVPPKEYSKQLTLSQYAEMRLIIVQGAENSGKFTCAVYIGLQLLQTPNPNLRLYRREPRDQITLLDFVHNERLERECVYILKDAFNYNVRIEDLKDELIPITNRLFDLNSYLLLTTTLPMDQLEELSVPIVPTDGPDMTQVLGKHLDYYTRRGLTQTYISKDLAELVRAQSAKFIDKFSSPTQVDRFCKRLYPLSNELPSWNIENKAIANQIDTLAEEVVSIAYEDPKVWFTKRLRANERLYAMLVLLFDELEYTTLNEIYFTSVYHLREEGIKNLIDPRQIGLQEILERVHAAVVETNTVSFDHETFKREVIRQLSNYHHLLWELLEPFQGLVEKFRSARYWQVRVIMGQAIGRIGIYNLDKLSISLDNLAGNSYSGVVVVVGNVLDEVCHSKPENYTYVLDTLERWVRSQRANLIWAAASAIWRIYDGIAEASRSSDPVLSDKASKAFERIHSIFTQLTRNHNKFSDNYLDEIRMSLANKKISEKTPIKQVKVKELRQFLSQKSNENSSTIVFTISKIFLNNARSIMQLLGEWLQSKNESNLVVLGLIAVQQLLEANAKEKVVLSKDRHIPLLDVLPVFISACIKIQGGSTFISFLLNTLQRWIEQGDSFWRDYIHEKLLETANFATTSERRILRDALANQWLTSSQESVRRLAQIIISRTVLLDGTPVAPHHSGKCLILIDESQTARRGYGSLKAATRLLHHLLPLLDVDIQSMGASQPIKSSEKLIHIYGRNYHEHAMPRLVAPILEGYNVEKHWITVLLVWGTIVDFDDIWDSEWGDTFLIASVYTTQWPDAANLVRVRPQWWQSESQFESRILFQAIYARIAYKALQLSLEDWHIDQDIDYKANIELYAQQIGNVVSSLEQHDIVGIINRLLTWKLQENPNELVNWLLVWLDSDKIQLQIIGLTGSKLVFTLYQRITPSADKFSDLLRLLPRLATHPDVGGFDLALQAIRRWIRHEDWLRAIQKMYENREPLLIQAIKNCTTVPIDRLVKTVQQWAVPIKELGESPKDLEPIKEYVNRLILWLKIGSERVIHALPEGTKFGIVLIDSSQNDIQNRNLFQAAHNFVELTNRDKEFDRVYTIIYRLGCQQPIALNNEIPAINQLVSSDLPSLPRLAGPILDMFSPESVYYVFIFTDQTVHDVDDWCVDWKQKTFVYSNHLRSNMIPCLKDCVVRSITDNNNRFDDQTRSRLLHQIGA